MKTIKEVYEEFKSKDNASIHIDLLEQIRNQTEYNFYRGVGGAADFFEDVSGTLFIDDDGKHWFVSAPEVNIQPRIWATNLKADEPYDIVALIDGVLYESPETYSRKEFVIASVNRLREELTKEFVKENWNETGYNKLAFDVAIKDWDDDNANS
ncbi:hypothetical protein AP1_0156 [Aeromonas phage AP1]|nr:hypothetical protein AP1_0156 [Aeromonas phage AP1]